MTLQVSRLKTVFDDLPRPYLLKTIALEMRKGNATLDHLHEDAPARTLEETTAYARELLELRGAEAYALIKQGMPQFMPGVITNGRSLEDVASLSGIVCLEWDHPEMDTPSAMAILCQNPHVLMAWRSLGGKPKVLLRVADTSADGAPLSLENYRYAWADTDILFQEIGESDPTACQPLQQQNICHDPDLYLNVDAVPLAWSIDAESFTERMPDGFGELQWRLIQEIGPEYLDAISEMDFNEEGVGSVRVPCPFGGNHAGDGWGSRDNATRVIQHSDTDVTFQCFKCSKSRRYNETGHYRKPVKLKDVKPYQNVLDTLDKARDFLNDFFVKCALLFALRTDTGTGKTESGITYAAQNEVTMSLGNTNLSIEIETRAIVLGVTAFRFRGIHYQPDEKHTIVIDGRIYDDEGYFPCVDIERFVSVRDRGFNQYLWVCGSCPFKAECQSIGYLSQPAAARRANLVALPFPTAFLNPLNRSFAKLYKPRGKNAVILHDDIPIGRMFYEVKVSQERLRQLAEDWKGTAAEVWAKALLKCIAERNWDLFKAFCFPESDVEAVVTEALTHCLDPFSGAIVTADDYIKNPSVDISTPEVCNKLPQVDAIGFDTLSMLQKFWTRYPRGVDAPFFYDVPSETVVFSLPPEPYRDARKTLKIGFASATLDKRLMEQLLPGIAFYDTNRTEWDERSGVWQLRTNRNPRSTVLTSRVEEKNGKKQYFYDGLSPPGEGYYNSVIDFIKAHPNDRHAVLSYKVLIEEKKDELDALGVVCEHFGNLAGLDTSFEGVKYFHILFAPFVNPSDIDFLSKQVFGNDPIPLLRDADGHLQRNEDGTFADERVQWVADSLVIAELLQAIGRARLNLYPNHVILWTSLFIDSVTNRAETVLFDEVDWQNAENNLDRLAEVVAERERTEQETAQAIDTGDVKAVQESAGVSNRTAERRTKNTRKQRKSERDAEVFRRYDAGASQQAIADALDINQATVSRILNRRAF